VALTLTSPAFVHGAAIPTMYTCDGADRSPPLAWDAAPDRPPCPPIGRHRYFFRLHALDAALPDLGEPDKPGLHRAMEGHLLATDELMGVYERSR
jgi:phosphatidylethanolamine-binding protein (PEBP) family uncharacterized protein